MVRIHYIKTSIAEEVYQTLETLCSFAQIDVVEKLDYEIMSTIYVAVSSSIDSLWVVYLNIFNGPT